MASTLHASLATPARAEARSVALRPTAAAQQRKEAAPAKQAAGALLASLAAAQLAALPLAGPVVAAVQPQLRRLGQEVARVAAENEPDAKNLGPNEVSKGLIDEFPNSSSKDKAAPGRSGTTFSNPSKDTGALTSTEGVDKATVKNTAEAAKGGASNFFSNLFGGK